MGLLDWILSHSRLARRVAELEVRVDALEGGREAKAGRNVEQILGFLASGPKTTREVAGGLGVSRTHASTLLNRLQREGRVVEEDKRGRQDLYRLP